MPKPESDAWQITLRAEGPGPPAYVRLKRALKNLLRSYQLRVTDIRQIKDQDDAPSVSTTDTARLPDARGD
jgi:hypothetical protein